MAWNARRGPRDFFEILVDTWLELWLDNDMSSTHTTESGPTRPMTGHQARKGSAMNAFTLTTTYAEACDHAQRNYEATNGLVRGGTYMVRFDDDTVVEVELRVGESGIARPAR